MVNGSSALRGDKELGPDKLQTRYFVEAVHIFWWTPTCIIGDIKVFEWYGAQSTPQKLHYTRFNRLGTIMGKDLHGDIVKARE